MKVMTILGTRPEIIRLSLTIKKLDKYCSHVLVHTGQNYEASLNGVFFSDLRLREPNYYLGVKGDSIAEQIGKILVETEKVIVKERPDRILILGDTNSGLVSIIARRMGIPVFHMEAGNRCFDDRVPEEINRRVIDHSSTVLMPYTSRSKENLVREGIDGKAIYVIGNPILEILEHYSADIEKSKILAELKVKPQEFFLVTMHRAENVDDKERLGKLLTALDGINKKYELPVICSLHPRTRNKMKQFGLKAGNRQVRFLDPLGYFDFVSLEKNAKAVVTDSGTVQEECCILKTPNITARDVTERPETIESGSNILSGVEPDTILKTLEIALDDLREWEPPVEYMARNVSSKVVKIILGYMN